MDEKRVNARRRLNNALRGGVGFPITVASNVLGLHYHREMDFRPEAAKERQLNLIKAMAALKGIDPKVAGDIAEREGVAR